MHLLPNFQGYLNPVDAGSRDVLQQTKYSGVLHHVNV